MAYSTQPPKHRRRPADAVARGLGWFSIGLGLFELIAPRMIGRRLGMGRRAGLIRAYGAREIATGVGILLAKQPAPWIVARVLGDGLDIGTLAPRLTSRHRYRRNAAIALGAVAGVTALDAFNAKQLSEHARRASEPRRDYSGRSGFPRPAEQMRGAARARPESARRPRTAESTTSPRLSS